MTNKNVYVCPKCQAYHRYGSKIGIEHANIKTHMVYYCEKCSVRHEIASDIGRKHLKYKFVDTDLRKPFTIPNYKPDPKIIAIDSYLNNDGTGTRIITGYDTFETNTGEKVTFGFKAHGTKDDNDKEFKIKSFENVHISYPYGTKFDNKNWEILGNGIANKYNNIINTVKDTDVSDYKRKKIIHDLDLNGLW